MGSIFGVHFWGLFLGFIFRVHFWSPFFGSFENLKLEPLKCEIFGHFQTMCLKFKLIWKRIKLKVNIEKFQIPISKSKSKIESINVRSLDLNLLTCVMLLPLEFFGPIHGHFSGSVYLSSGPSDFSEEGLFLVPSKS